MSQAQCRPLHRAVASIATVLAFLLIGVQGPGQAAETPPEQRLFDSPALAMEAVKQALRGEDEAALKAIFGPGSEEILSSGDEVADRLGRERFLAMAEEGVGFEHPSPDRAIVDLGEDKWPFPIPLVKSEGGWRFDSEAGKDEILNRRIGANELTAIAVARAYVDAQDEYAAADPTGEGVRQYAQNFRSSEGKRDGLYWPAAEGEAESPLGPLVAEAVEEGYGQKESEGEAEGTDEEPSPYHGYYFRILKAQGKHAPGGEKSYLDDAGRMTEGFALVAYPAQYENSGIMSFIVNRQGIVFQKDLGAETDKIAEAMSAYDPDDTWDPVSDTQSEG